MAYEEVQAENFTNNNFFTGGLRKRLVLVLDCVTPHDFEYVTRLMIINIRYLHNFFKLNLNLLQPKIIGIYKFTTVFD